ncbi:MAG TPA: DUF1559 domain-containing protein [Planctomycetaceae bacterium]|nr:DUF1559 domain-containing protein [Planctomycetaceae bacterium]
MPAITFHCPHCAANLKIRDDQITSSPVACPDCRKPMLIMRDEFGNVAAAAPAPAGSPAKGARSQKPPASGKAVGTATGKSQTTPPIVREEPPEAPAQGQPLWKRLSRKATLWIGAGVAGLAVILVAGTIFFWPRGSRSASHAVEADDPNLANMSGNQRVTGKNSPLAGQASRINPAANAGQNGPKPPTVAGRLGALGQRIAEYRAKRVHFPGSAPGRDGLPASERLSWLAELVATVLQPERPAPAWNESWRSQRNERFVRQRIPEFLNPSIDRLTGPENYPTTHFAGVAGVGADAADLPVDHPRAGIFGNTRSTRMEDIRDGASNTLMVVGVTGDLGSWAAAGKPTVRAFTREPYVNGPDGIGTGSPDRMMVLKADGSVQEFSSKTDPRILRRMAAMADGLPLDPKVPGEPGDKSPQPSLDQLTALVAKVQPAPSGAKATDGMSKAPDPVGTRPPVAAARPVAKKSSAPPAPKVDVSTALAQRVARSEQSKPVPLRDVLNWLEELATVPIRGDRHEIPDLDDLLQTPVSWELENTTVAAILETVLAPARLNYQVKPDAIQLHRLGPAAGRAASP